MTTMNKKIKKKVGKKETKQFNLLGELAKEPTEKVILKRHRREKKWKIEREHMRNEVTHKTLCNL